MGAGDGSMLRVGEAVGSIVGVAVGESVGAAVWAVTTLRIGPKSLRVSSRRPKAKAPMTSSLLSNLDEAQAGTGRCYCSSIQSANTVALEFVRRTVMEEPIMTLRLEGKRKEILSTGCEPYLSRVQLKF